jgi:hypothetical protein
VHTQRCQNRAQLEMLVQAGRPAKHYFSLKLKKIIK